MRSGSRKSRGGVICRSPAPECWDRRGSEKRQKAGISGHPTDPSPGGEPGLNLCPAVEKRSQASWVIRTANPTLSNPILQATENWPSPCANPLASVTSFTIRINSWAGRSLVGGKCDPCSALLGDGFLGLNQSFLKSHRSRPDSAGTPRQPRGARSDDQSSIASSLGAVQARISDVSGRSRSAVERGSPLLPGPTYADITHASRPDRPMQLRGIGGRHGPDPALKDTVSASAPTPCWTEMT